MPYQDQRRLLDFSQAEVRGDDELERIINRVRQERQRLSRNRLLQRVEIGRDLDGDSRTGGEREVSEAAAGGATTRPRPRPGLVSSDGETASPGNMSTNQRDLQRRFSREPAPRHSEALPSFASLATATALPPLRSLGTRRGTATSTPTGSSGRPARQRLAERWLDRYRTSENRTSNPTSFEDLEYDLDDANSQLRALLDYTNTAMMPSPLSPTSHSHTPYPEQVEDSRRVKRRKLDSERAGSSFKGFRYGRFGQIEPGQLKMEIESCDGGMYADSNTNPPGSILKRDNSVYCTKRNRCNIVLKHQGATVFTLSELVIRAPSANYSSPIREGMVFVSMACDEVLNRTAQYQVQYVPRDDTRTPSERARHNYDMSISRSRQRRINLNARLEEALEHKAAVFPVEPLPFPVTVATDCSDTEESPVPRLLRRQAPPPNRIGPLPFESDDSEDGENGFAPWNDDMGLNDDDSSPPPAPPPVDRDAQDMTLAEAAEASQLATQEAVRAVGGELLAPHAKFYIEKDKNRCTIRFDPPISGRYILLKMYHPTYVFRDQASAVCTAFRVV
ncbi:hypothetical protein FJTKL_10351 [Diaporthe vaccinii]|uniref:Uncharacterized protein n=2 Tax=Diaporthe vaccinii TaxID=105482 RepID=A0ABR4EJV8_9PEZI